MFLCVVTGIYGYPPERAAACAVETVRAWLERGTNASLVDCIIFVTFLPHEVANYDKQLTRVFPKPPQPTAAAVSASTGVSQLMEDVVIDVDL